MRNVLYVPGRRNALDYAVERPDGVVYALFDGRSLEELSFTYPGVMVGTEEEFESQRAGVGGSTQ